MGTWYLLFLQKNFFFHPTQNFQENIDNDRGQRLRHYFVLVVIVVVVVIVLSIKDCTQDDCGRLLGWKHPTVVSTI